MEEAWADSSILVVVPAAYLDRVGSDRGESDTVPGCSLDYTAAGVGKDWPGGKAVGMGRDLLHILTLKQYHHHSSFL